jgi:hypothetical protein
VFCTPLLTVFTVPFEAIVVGPDMASVAGPDAVANAGEAASTVMAGAVHAAVTPVRTTVRLVIPPDAAFSFFDMLVPHTSY